MNDSLFMHDVHAVRGTREILRGVSLRVSPGEVCALMGESGAGKSTVLRAIAALEPFQAGRISVCDVELAPGPLAPQSALATLRSKVGMVFQAHALFEHLTVRENITLAPERACVRRRIQITRGAGRFRSGRRTAAAALGR
jgi:ABC-type polar amino acid transport system ATPase subunit